MKILMISPSFRISNGGAENQLALILLELKKKKIKVDYLNKRKLEFLYPFFYIIKILIKLISKNYSIIHAHTFNSPTWIIAILSFIFKFKLLVKITLSGKKSRLDRVENNFFLKKIFIFLFKRDKIYFFSITKDIKKRLIKIGISPKNIFFCPNGTIVKKFHKKKFKKKNLIYFGRIIKRKRIFELVELLEKNRNLDITLNIFGNGPLKNKIYNLIKTKNIKNIFLNKKFKNNKILKKINDFNICINPSTNEGMSNSILEAQSNGLVVIARNTVENREIIKNNYTGFLFKNDFELVRLLRKLNNKKLLETISLRAYKNINEKHNIKSITNRILKFYIKITKS